MSLQIRSPAAQIKTFGHAHNASTTAKTPLVINGSVFIPLNSAAASVRNAFVYEAEVTGIPKAAVVIAVGDALFWNGTAATTDDDTGSNPAIGHALQASASGDDETGMVAFNSFA